MHKITPILLIATIIILITSTALHAQGSSPSASESIRNAVKEKVMEKIQNVVSRKVGIVGTIINITNGSINVQANGQDYTINTTADTQYQRTPGKRTIQRDELELNQSVIILGHQQLDSSSIAASIIQIIPAPTLPQRQTIIATVDEITKNTLTLTASNQQSWTISTSKLTSYVEKTTANKIATIKSTVLKPQDKVIVGGTPDDQDLTTLKSAFIIRITPP